MKKWFSVTLAAVLCLSLAGCTAKLSDYVSDSDAREAQNGVTGTVIDSTKFHVLCPEGWLNIPQSDVFGEQDENGDFPINPDTVMFVKGARSEWDVFNCPSLTIAVLTGTVDEDIATLAWFYDETEQTTFQLNGASLTGLKLKQAMSEEPNDYYAYEVVYFAVDEVCFSATLVVFDSTNGANGLSVTDEDVQAIVASVTLD